MPPKYAADKDFNENECEASFSSEEIKPVRRGRKAQEVFEFELNSLKKIAEF